MSSFPKIYPTFCPLFCPECENRLTYQKHTGPGPNSYIFHNLRCDDNIRHLSIAYQKDWLLQSMEARIFRLTVFTVFLPHSNKTTIERIFEDDEHFYDHPLFNQPILIPWHLDDWDKMKSLVKTLVTFQ